MPKGSQPVAVDTFTGVHIPIDGHSSPRAALIERSCAEIEVASLRSRAPSKAGLEVRGSREGIRVAIGWDLCPSRLEGALRRSEETDDLAAIDLAAIIDDALGTTAAQVDAEPSTRSSDPDGRCGLLLAVIEGSALRIASFGDGVALMVGDEHRRPRLLTRSDTRSTHAISAGLVGGSAIAFVAGRCRVATSTLAQRHLSTQHLAEGFATVLGHADHAVAVARCLDAGD